VTLDTSAIIAILFAEPGYLDLVDRILAAGQVRVGTATLVETGLVFAGRRRTQASGELEALLRELDVTIVPFGEREYRAAVDAFLRFGRGRHKAALSFGDCFAYAVADTANDSLLFVGNDFAQTDITAA
jgi:ribonuclease VapC